jgi:hypothetical protein
MPAALSQSSSLSDQVMVVESSISFAVILRSWDGIDGAIVTGMFHGAPAASGEAAKWLLLSDCLTDETGVLATA